MASRWRYCANLIGPGIESQTYRTDSVCLATNLLREICVNLFFTLCCRKTEQKDGTYREIDSDDELLRPVSFDAWKYERAGRDSTSVVRRRRPSCSSSSSESDAEREYQRKRFERERRRREEEMTAEITTEQAWKEAALESRRRKKKMEDEPEYMKKIRRRRYIVLFCHLQNFVKLFFNLPPAHNLR